MQRLPVLDGPMVQSIPSPRRGSCHKCRPNAYHEISAWDKGEHDTAPNGPDAAKGLNRLHIRGNGKHSERATNSPASETATACERMASSPKNAFSASSATSVPLEYTRTSPAYRHPAISSPFPLPLPKRAGVHLNNVELRSLFALLDQHCTR